MYFQDNQEPAPSKWQTWAQVEVQHQKLTSVSPVISPKIKNATMTTRPLTLSQPTQPVPKKTISTPTIRDSTKYAAPTLDQIDFVLLDPPHCFCNRPAHRTYTLEYGPILECATYGPLEQGKFICGFHVHEYSWQQFRNQVKQTGGSIESQYNELKTCPLYNFSFCTLFHLSNPYDKVPPTVIPNCFCGLPVKLREKYNTDRKLLIYFTCPNSTNEGVKKCSWYLDSKKVAFIKPTYRLHTLVDKEAYHANYQEEKNSLAQQHQQQQASQSQHHSELLATLSAKSPTSHLVVPTSVLANNKKQPVASLSSSSSSASSSTSTSSTLSSPTIHQQHHHSAQLSLDEENAVLEHNISQSKKDAKARMKEVESQLFHYIERANQAESETVKYQKKMNQLKSEVTQLSTEMNHLTTDMKHLTTELNHLKVQYEREHISRISAQAGTSKAEVKNLEMHAEIERIQNKFEQYRESVLVKYGKEEEYNKCKVCFHRNIEYVLTPCFHLAYCDLCAHKLKECAICRMEINGVHKVYNC
ncbi:hypothetical protein BD770DRAFT_410607 [Pilaira anomala]|nr:hypothetical protein BD770DRAFT_410607 [Pilaira anomala]